MDFKRYLPHVAAIAIFFIITAVFFGPLFDGKRIRQGDVEQFLGSSKEIKDFREKTGEEPLWTNSMFGGMPAYQISVLYPNNMVQYIQKTLLKLLPSPAAIILVGMLGFYILLLAFKIDPWLSVGGAITYGLSSYVIVILAAGHNTQAMAVAYMAPVLMGVIVALRGKMFLGAAFTALALSLEIYANHLQVTYYLLILIVFVAIGEAIRLVRAGEMNYLLKSFGLLAVAALIAILPNITNLMLTEEYGKASTRGKSDITIDNKEQTKTNGLPIEYATQWSYGKSETFTLMIPDFQGGASAAIGSYAEDALNDVDPNYKEYIGNRTSAYFGGQPFTSGPVYVGAIICFLFILGLFIVKDNIKWWLLGATVLAILLAWGSNFIGFTEFFFYNVPGYNKFRAVYMILVIVQITMPLLAMLTLREIITNAAELKSKLRSVYIAFALTGGVALLIYLMPTSFVTPTNMSDTQRITQDVQQQGGGKQDIDNVLMNLETARVSIVQSDALRSFMFILLTGALVFFFIRKPFGALPFAIVTTILLLADMWGVSRRYLTEDDYEPKKTTEGNFFMSPADEKILADQSQYRVLNVATQTWQDARTSYFHKSIGGYHGAKLKRIQELYEQVLERQLYDLRSSMQKDLNNDSMMRIHLSRQSALNMLNGKYIIFNPEQGGVLTNQFACGNAWFVNQLKIVPNADSEVVAVRNFNPRRTAIVDQIFQKELGEIKPRFDSTASISLVSYAPNDLKYQSNASSEQLAVFSEIYYDKGWNAYLDGKPVPHFRADFVLRGMKVPAGKHEIEFKFEPASYITGEKIALTGSLLLFLFVGGAIFLDYRRKKANVVKAA